MPAKYNSAVKKIIIPKIIDKILNNEVRLTNFSKLYFLIIFTAIINLMILINLKKRVRLNKE